MPRIRKRRASHVATMPPHSLGGRTDCGESPSLSHRERIHLLELVSTDDNGYPPQSMQVDTVSGRFGAGTWVRFHFPVFKDGITFFYTSLFCK